MVSMFVFGWSEGLGAVDVACSFVIIHGLGLILA